MSLSCSCYSGGDDTWLWYEPDDYSTLNTKRRRRCKSCGTPIDVGAIVARFARERYAQSDIEEKIYGNNEPIPMADWYHCENCADQYFNLTELGFCVYPGDNVRELVREYAAMAAEARG